MARHDWRLGVLVTIAACGPPPAIRQLRRDHPSLAYRAIASNCQWTPKSEGRRFESLQAAILWGRQTLSSARLRTCEVTIEAADQNPGRPFYRIAIDSTGRRLEGPLPAGQQPDTVRREPESR